jgi:hypothetical protein
MQPGEWTPETDMEISMKGIPRLAAAAAAIAMAGACADVGAPSADVAGALAAFESVPAGFSSTNSSFDAAGDLDQAFHPHRGDGSFDDDANGHRGPNRGPGRGDDHRGRGRRDGFGFLMGGGIGPEFLGEIGFGPGRGRGPFHVDSVGSSCVFSSATGIVTCGPIIRGGLTILATAAITTTDGTSQPKIDAATDRVVLGTEVSGTRTYRDSATSVIAHRSTRTISGLADGSAQRAVDGTSTGTETTTGATDAGAFEAIRTVNDTTEGIIVPLVNGRPTYPSAGRISRNMSVTVTVEGVTTTHSRSEIVTYDGTATASVAITQDGTTKNCTLPLPRGRLACQ